LSGSSWVGRLRGEGQDMTLCLSCWIRQRCGQSHPIQSLYQPIQPTDALPAHLSAAFLRMVVAYKEKIGATYQLLIEPKPKEPR
jgi:hypothetical protein